MTCKAIRIHSNVLTVQTRPHYPQTLVNWSSHLQLLFKWYCITMATAYLAENRMSLEVYILHLIPLSPSIFQYEGMHILVIEKKTD